MIQDAAKQRIALWIVGEKKYEYTPFFLYELFVKQRTGAPKKVANFWLTYFDKKGVERVIGDISPENIETKETFVKKMKANVIANRNGAALQQYSISRLKEKGGHVDTALQRVVQSHRERASALEKALQEMVDRECE